MDFGRAGERPRANENIARVPCPNWNLFMAATDPCWQDGCPKNNEREKLNLES